MWGVLGLLTILSTPVAGKEAKFTAEQARAHVIMVDERGRHLDPARKWKLRGVEEPDGTFDYDKNLAAIAAGLQTFQTAGSNRMQRVIVFVHGGLNSYATSKTRLGELLTGRMMNDGYYPILVVWNSGFFDSYWEHLTSIRQGEVRPWQGRITAPAVFLRDLSVGLVRLPVTLAGRWYNDFRTAEVPNWTDGATKAWEDMEASIQAWQTGQPELGTNSLINPPEPELTIRKNDERLFRLFFYFLTQPTKIALLPIADGLATQAWDNMIRRTKTMFRPPETYEFPIRYRKQFFRGNKAQPGKHGHARRQAEKIEAVHDWINRKVPTNGMSMTRLEPDGTMFKFGQWLETRTRSDHEAPSLRWQFYGHSMGTMVLNELFRIAPDIRAERIVYMAAACSIRDFQESLAPYLRAHPSVSFHNLCLHRIRERDNSMDKVDLIPRGTLLNYIDDILAKPATVADRTLGSWENVVRALPNLSEDLRPQIHHVCFDLLAWSFSRNNPKQPQNHGSFSSKFEFWKDEFLLGLPTVPPDPEAYKSQR